MKKKTKKAPRRNSRQAKVKRVKTEAGIKPLADRVLVKPFTEEEVKGEKNHYGIIIPDTVSKEKSAQGKVMAVGEGKWVDGKLVPVRIKVGDTVIFSKYSYDEVEYKGAELYLLKEENVLAVIK